MANDDPFGWVITSHRQAEAVCAKVEDLVSASITGHAAYDETSRWVVSLDETLYGELAAVGLVKPREALCLRAFIRAST